MCGIAGIIGAPQGPATRESLVAMLAAIQHRGPDSAGLYQDGDAAIGSRRLSIIDVAGGDQPIANETEDMWVVYNGEIYNFPALRDELRDRGHVFRTHADTEIIVHGYEELGPRWIEQLEGMFALALWDARTRSLLLARDRFGKKPLYYTNVGEQLVFASEIQAIATHPGFRARPDLDAIDSYLTYSVVASERAALAGVRRVPAATAMVWRDGRVASTQRYWQLTYRPVTDVGFDEAAHGFRERFERAVASRLISDVPVGAFLSGGLDSSSVVAAMALASPQRVRTFSVGFDEHKYDELEFARAVARRFGTDHTEARADPHVGGVLPMLVGHFGEPFADASALPTYLISSVASKHLKVVLSGDGGDELLGGYRRHHIAEMGERLSRTPLGLAGRVVEAASGGAVARNRYLRVVQTFGLPLPARYVRWRSTFTEGERRVVRGPALREATPESPDALPASLADVHLSAAERVMAADIEHYLVFDLMPKTDITAMSCSLEVRSPFLDRSLVEYVAHLPVQYRLVGGHGKRLLRAAMADVLPREVLSRGKHGFDVPVGAWLRGELRPLVGDCVLGERVRDRGFVDVKAAARIVARHEAGDGRASQQLWTLVMLELWARAFLDGEYHPTPPSAALTPRELIRDAS